jgi:two-component system, OmpR family, response regulator ChvI
MVVLRAQRAATEGPDRGKIAAQCGERKAREHAHRLRYIQRMPSPDARLVAVVEDESTIREAIAAALVKEGYLVESFSDGMRAWEAFARQLPDLAVLDIGVPRIDGLEICRRLRGLSDTIPIIFVTSREEEFDRVLGLELGADDYLCKPFSMRELMARVKVLFRRSSLSSTAARDEDDRPATVGDLTLDPLRLIATWKDVPLALTVTEFLLLQALARRPGIVKTREQLMQETYPDAISVTDRTIDSHVKRIRRKFESVDRSFAALESVYGAGYRYVGPRE